MPLSLWVGLVGMTLIVTWSHLFRRIRAWCPSFLGCPLCVGTWIGWAGGLIARSVMCPRLPGFEIVCIGPAVGLLSLFVVGAANRVDQKP